MLSYTTEVDQDLSLEQLSTLASKLKLPDGFKFEIKTLTRDLSIDLRNANGLATSFGTTSTIYTRAAVSTTPAITSRNLLAVVLKKPLEERLLSSLRITRANRPYHT